MADNILRPTASTRLPGAPQPAGIGRLQGLVARQGAAAEDLGQAGIQIAQDWQRHRDEADATKAGNQALDQIDALEAELEQSQNPAEIRDRAEARLLEIQREAGAEIRSNAAREAFEARFQSVARAARARVRRRATALEIDQGVASLNASGEKYADQAARGGTAAQRSIAIGNFGAGVDAAAAAGWITAEDAERRKRTFAADVDETAAIQMVVDDPYTARAALAPGGKLFPHLGERDRIRLKAGADRAVKAIEAEARAAAREARAAARIDASLGLQDYGQVVAAGAVPDAATDAALDKQIRATGDARMAARFASYRAQAATNAEVQAMSPAELRAARASAAAALEDGATADEVARLQTYDRALKPLDAAAKRQSADQATRALDDIEDVLDSGRDPGEDAWKAAAVHVLGAESAELERRFDALAEQGRAQAGIQGKNPYELATMAEGLAAELESDAPAPAAVRLENAVAARLKAVNDAASRDALQAYVRETGTPVPVVEWGDDKAVRGQLLARSALADKAERWHGQPAMLLTSAEIKTAQRWFAKAQPLEQAQFMAVLGSIQTAASARTAEAIAGGDKAAYAAGGLMRMGPQHLTKVEDIMEGRALIKAGEGVKPTPTVAEEGWLRAWGDALDRPADIGPKQRYQAAAEAIFAARAVQHGISQDAMSSNSSVRDEAIDLMADAYQAAAGRWRSAGGDKGGIGTVNGARVALPQDGDEDEIEDTVAALDRANVIYASRSGAIPVHVTATGQRIEVDPADIEDMRLESVGEGLYRVWNPASRGYLMDGADLTRPWILDLSRGDMRRAIRGVRDKPSGIESQADDQTRQMQEGVPPEAFTPFRSFGGDARDARNKRLFGTEPR